MDLNQNTRSLIVPLSRSYLCNTKPPISKEFNNEDTSDLRIRSGERIFHVHRLVLACGSPVFRRMLYGNWAESCEEEVTLSHDDEELVSPFLQFLYTGHIIMTSSNIIRFYQIADKYCVKSLMRHAQRFILEGLSVQTKVFDADKKPPLFCPHVEAPERSSQVVAEACPSSSSPPPQSTDELSEWFSKLPLYYCFDCRFTLIQPCMHFGLSTVIDLVSHPNRRFANAAYISLLTCLVKLLGEAPAVMAAASTMPQSLLLKILQDDNFCGPEDKVFDLVFGWLQANPSCGEEAAIELLSHVRFPRMSRTHLYRCRSVLSRMPWATPLLVETMEKRLGSAERFQLYSGLVDAATSENWHGQQYAFRNGFLIFVASAKVSDRNRHCTESDDNEEA